MAMALSRRSTFFASRRLAAASLVAVLASFSFGCAAEFFCAFTGGTWWEYPTGPNLPYLDPECLYLSGGKSSVAVGPGEGLLVAASAHLAGALGTNWRSDVQVDNVGDGTAEFDLILLKHGEDNSNPEVRELSLAPGESLRLSDVLVEEFAFDGQAALYLVPSVGRITVASRTYNLLGAGNDLGLPSGATFGQYIPAQVSRSAIAEGEKGRLIQLSHSFSDSRGSRTNLGLVNVTDAECTVLTDFYTANGASLGRVTTTLAPYEYKQINKVFQRVTSTDVDDGYAITRTTTAGGRFFAFASVVDNLTGDPVAISAIKDSQAVTGVPITIVAAAHVAGAAGTNWRTDLEIHNPGSATATYTVELLKHGVNNSSPTSKTYTLAGGHSVRITDILASEFGSVSQAALRITATTGRVMVTSRTYNLLGAGNAFGLPAGATFGQYIPGLTDAEAIGFGGQGRLIQLAHQPGDSGFRTNLVLVNAVGSRIDTVIDLYAADGTLLGTVNRSLAPYEYRQLNGIFGSVTSAAIADGYAVVRTTDEGGRFFALASVVDNVTGDPVGMAAAEILSPDSSVVVEGAQSVSGIFAGVGFENLVSHVTSSGVGGILSDLASAQSDVATRVGDTLVVDYGDGYTSGDGSVLSGSMTIDASGLTVGNGSINGTVAIDRDALLVDGQPPEVGSTNWQVGLATRTNGTVHGQVTISPGGNRKTSGAISGTIDIDTAICLEYPTGGSLTVDLGGEIVSMTFSPDCSGDLQPNVEPGKAFSYSYGNPEETAAQTYIVSTSNAEVGEEGTGRYWRPTVGAENFADAPPGVITFHFPFSSPVVSGHLKAQIVTFHWSYSEGVAELYGSTDGATWQLLSHVDPPEYGTAASGGWNADLPDMFIGASDIWLRVKLVTYGPSAASGGINCNTAQFSRWDGANPTTTFELQAQLE